MKIHMKVIISIALVSVAVLSFGSSVNKNTKLAIKTMEQFESIDNGFIYFGREECPSCSLFEKPLYKVAKQNLVKINYVETNLFRKSGDLEEVLSKYNVQSSPTLIEVVDGTVDNYLHTEILKYSSKDQVEKDISQIISTSPVKIELSNHQITNIVIYLMVLALMIFVISSKVLDSKVLVIGSFLLIVNYFNIGVGVGIEGYNKDYFTYIEYIDALGLYNMIIVAICFIIYFVKMVITKSEVIKED